MPFVPFAGARKKKKKKMDVLACIGDCRQDNSSEVVQTPAFGWTVMVMDQRDWFHRWDALADELSTLGTGHLLWPCEDFGDSGILGS